MKIIRCLFFSALFLTLACEEKVTYIEVPVEVEVEVENPYVSVSVASSSTTYLDGIPYIRASGRVKNHGPGNVTRVRIMLTSNHGYSRTVTSNPSNLSEGQGGSWAVSGLAGTYIRYKDVLFTVGS